MRKHTFTSGIKQETFQLKNFLGVDFSTHESEVDSKRSPDAKNMIAGKQGSIDKRLGVDIVDSWPNSTSYHRTVVAMQAVSYWYTGYSDPANVSSASESSMVESKLMVTTDEQGYYYVHLGTLGVELKGLVETGTVYSLVSFDAHTYTFSDNESRKPRFIRLDDYNYLLIGVPKIMLIHIRANNIYPSVLADSFLPSGSTQYANQTCYGYVVDFIPSKALQYTHFHTPTKTIARKPNGSVFTVFEGENLLSTWTRHEFLSDGTSTIYMLGDTIVDLASVKVFRRIAGVWTAVTTGWTASNGSSVGIVTFTTAPVVPSVVGEDNIRIDAVTYYIGSANSAINWLTNYEYFGYNGGNQYAFVCMNGNRGTGLINRDFRIRLEDWYMDTNGTTDFGSKTSRILGYSLYNDYLVTHTEKVDENPTIFLRRASVDADGEATFPVQTGIVGVGALNGDTFASLRGDTMWLSEYGIVALVTNNITNTQAIQDRGFYVNDNILKSLNSKTLGFVYDNKYFLFTTTGVYVADPRKKFSESLSFSESYQYDWYYLQGMLANDYAIVNGILYWCYSNYVYKFKLESNEYAYYDEHFSEDYYIEKEIGRGLRMWNDPLEEYHTYGSGDIVYLSGDTIKYYVCIKTHDEIKQGIMITDERYWIEIILENSYFQIPVIAYWTTPIMNMNNITAKKTLKNLWVRFQTYTHSGCRIYYSDKGILKQKKNKYFGLFDFSDLDFSQLTFSTDTDPTVIVTNVQQRKFMSIQFKIESRDGNPMSLLEIVGKYTTNNTYKG